MKQLAGVILCFNAIRHDYCYLEAIASLLSACDHVFIVDPGSTDGTTDTLLSLNGPITVIQTNNWNEFHGKEKLAALQNIGSFTLSVNVFSVSIGSAPRLCQSDNIGRTWLPVVGAAQVVP